MNEMQLYLTVLLLVIEVVAFAWLILDNVKSKKKQLEIIKLEKKILELERTILTSEESILQEIQKVNESLNRKL